MKLQLHSGQMKNAELLHKLRARVKKAEIYDDAIVIYSIGRPQG